MKIMSSYEFWDSLVTIQKQVPGIVSLIPNSKSTDRRSKNQANRTKQKNKKNQNMKDTNGQYQGNNKEMMLRVAHRKKTAKPQSVYVWVSSLNRQSDKGESRCDRSQVCEHCKIRAGFRSGRGTVVAGLEVEHQWSYFFLVTFVSVSHRLFNYYLWKLK